MGQGVADLTAGHGQPAQAQPEEPATPLPAAHGHSAVSDRPSVPEIAADPTTGHGQPAQAPSDKPAPHLLPLPAAHGLLAGSTGPSTPDAAAAQFEAPPGKRQKLDNGPDVAPSAGAGPASEVAADPAVPAESAEQGLVTPVVPAQPAKQGLVTPAKRQLGRWPNICQDSSTLVVARDDDGGVLATMPHTSAQLGAIRVRVELNPLVLIAWMDQHDADALSLANLAAGLLGRIGLPAKSVHGKECKGIDCLLQTLGVHHACFGTADIHLEDVWLQRVPMAAQVASLSIAIPKGGFNQRSLCTSQLTKVPFLLGAFMISAHRSQFREFCTLQSTQPTHQMYQECQQHSGCLVLLQPCKKLASMICGVSHRS